VATSNIQKGRAAGASEAIDSGFSGRWDLWRIPYQALDSRRSNLDAFGRLQFHMLPLYDDNPAKRPPVVVVAVVVCCLVVMGFEFTRPSERALDLFVRTWGLVPASLWRHPEASTWLTLLTHMFLHGGIMHLAGNCWFLWIFGNNIEDRLGHFVFVCFYVVCGLAAAAAQIAFGPNSTVPMIGASGAISGVLGAYLRFFPKVPVYTFTGIWFFPIAPIPAAVLILVWFGFQFWQGVGTVFSTGTEGGVAWWAHIGGFVAGVLLAPLLERSTRSNARRRRR
jgi:membrane associated rhomboid family serine protease